MTQNFIDIIKARGFVHQFTDEEGLRALVSTPGQKAYIGFDCTAKSLHVGSLVQIMLLRWWQKCGHQPIVLLGGGTTKIGDPSGKDESRPKLDDTVIAENMAGLKQVFAQFIEFGDGKAVMVNNDDWLKDINYIEFLRDYGRHFSVNRMLTMDSVKLRLEREQPLSFLEFNYMILQAYDFVELNKRLGCCVQMGGSDQWGNIINGIDLHKSVITNGPPLQDPFIRTERFEGKFNRDEFTVGEQISSISTKEDADRFGKRIDNILDYVKSLYPQYKSKRIVRTQTADHHPDGTFTSLEFMWCDRLFGITSPLLTTASGAKMGKTASGAVWLNPEMLKPYDYWQFWRNTDDADVIRFLKLFTEISLEQIAEYETWVGSARINEAKIILATEATTLLHGRDAAEKAAQTAAETFGGAGVSADLPEVFVSPEKVDAGVPVYELLVLAGFATSNGEARRLIKGNGVKIDDVAITDDNQRITRADFAEEFLKLSKGKKQHVLVKIG